MIDVGEMSNCRSLQANASYIITVTHLWEACRRHGELSPFR